MNNLSLYMTIGGGILCLVGSFLAFREDSKHKDIIIESNRQLIESNKQLIESSQQLIKASDENIGYLIGGENYPMADVLYNHQEKKFWFSISKISEGKYKQAPIQDIHITIRDLDLEKKYDDLMAKTPQSDVGQKIRYMEQSSLSEKHLAVHYLGSATEKISEYYELPEPGEERNFEIGMTSRNGSVTQLLTIYYDEQEKRYFDKLKFIKDGKILYNTIEKL